MRDSKSVYQQFVDFEERAATIYLQLASRFSNNRELSSFWLDMAMQEKQHAGLLQFCLCESLFASMLPTTSEIEALRALFDGFQNRAAEPHLTVSAAFSIAIEMEASEINSIYCHLTEPVHSAMYLLRRKIATSLPNHVDELIAAARKFGVEEYALAKLSREKERCSGQWQLQQ
jgi:rubrerythrin